MNLHRRIAPLAGVCGCRFLLFSFLCVFELIVSSLSSLRLLMFRFEMGLTLAQIR